MEFKLTLHEAPTWMDGLIFQRDGDDVTIEVRKESGSDYGYARINAATFVGLLSVLGLKQ